MEAKGLAEGSNHSITEGLESFISVDNARALVTMGELAQFKDVHKNRTRQCTKMQQWLKGSQRFAWKSKERKYSFCGYGKDPEWKMETSSDGGGLGCLMSGTASVSQRGTVDLKCARNPRKFPQTLESRTGCELCSPSAGAHAARLAETRNSSEVVQDLGALRNTDLQREVDLQGQLLAAQRSRVTFVVVKSIGKPATFSSEPGQVGAWALKLGNFLEGVSGGMKAALAESP